MSKFQRTLVCGVGINDADYPIGRIIEGKEVRCPYYTKWVGMLRRAYSKDYHQRQPTYEDVEVCEEWLTFSNFKKWMEQQDWEGKALDKDLLVEGNKVYSSETCCFVPQEINNLLCDHRGRRGKYPMGVTYRGGIKKFSVRVSLKGKYKWIGNYETLEEAESMAKIAKAISMLDTTHKVSDGRVKIALTKRAIKMLISTL